MKEGYGQSCDRSTQKNAIPIIDLNSFEFTDLKQSIVEAERYILKELGFKIWQLTGQYSVHSQATHILEVLSIVKKDEMSDQDKKVFQQVWSLSNLVYFTPLACSYSPQKIALSIIIYVFKISNIQMPKLIVEEDR